jgi:methylenetetrahydrofolate reductase (NADPH)
MVGAEFGRLIILIREKLMSGQQYPNISFEFFPPKTPEGKNSLEVTALSLAQAHPAFFSVTFGAGGSTREGTLETVSMLQKKTHVSVTPHLACVGSSRADIIEILHQYKAMGVKRLVALRGDLPSGMGQAGEFRYANELVELIREITQDHFHIEIAAYPEFHPQASNALVDFLNFKKKVDAGANSAITQYFFNPDAYFYFRDYCAKQGVFIPITPGIMPITHFSKLVRFSDMCGAEIPRWIRKRLEAYGDDQVAIQAFGLELVYDLCQRLLENGAPGLHFYTLNHAETSLQLVKMLNLSAERVIKNSHKIDSSILQE